MLLVVRREHPQAVIAQARWEHACLAQPAGWAQLVGTWQWLAALARHLASPALADAAVRPVVWSQPLLVIVWLRYWLDRLVIGLFAGGYSQVLAYLAAFVPTAFVPTAFVPTAFVPAVAKNP